LSFEVMSPLPKIVSRPMPNSSHGACLQLPWYVFRSALL
jgi:hypothetical protein